MEHVFPAGNWGALGVSSIASLAASAAWLPVSIVLAGNLTLNFSGWRGSVWIAFTVAVVVSAFFSFVLALLASLLSLRRRAGAA
jgi:hypothetical protein